MTNGWLPITEYSSKYHVSISTLRRKIKAQDIKFTFEDGKYLIFDQPLKVHSGPPPNFRPSQVPARSPSLKSKESLELPQVESQLSKTVADQEPLLSAANRLLNELKKAYSQILLEKEEQILHLREEVSDLKTLVRVLEAENERLMTGQ